MSILNITQENFETEVLNSEDTILVDFFATWCGPCKMLSPIIDKLAEEEPQYKFAKVDIDEQSSLAATFQIMSVPTVLIFKDGTVAAKTSGLVTKETLLEKLKSVK